MPYDMMSEIFLLDPKLEQSIKKEFDGNDHYDSIVREQKELLAKGIKKGSKAEKRIIEIEKELIGRAIVLRSSGG